MSLFRVLSLEATRGKSQTKVVNQQKNPHEGGRGGKTQDGVCAAGRRALPRPGRAISPAVLSMWTPELAGQPFVHFPLGPLCWDSPGFTG